MGKTKITKVDSFNNANVKAILAECEDALKAIADKHGLALSRQNCRYSGDSLPTAFRFLIHSEATAGMNGHDAEIAGAYVKHAAAFGLDPSWLGKGYDDPYHTRVTIIGLAPKSTKYPVIVEAASGTRFKFALDTVIRGMTPNEVAKVGPGAKVCFKHEDEARGDAIGPAYLVDADGKRKHLQETKAGIVTVDEDVSDVDPVTGARPFNRNRTAPAWVHRSVARRFAASVGATFVEG